MGYPPQGAGIVTIITKLSGLEIDVDKNWDSYRIVNVGAPTADTHVPRARAGDILSGQLALARGGTGVDLSGTGGTGQYLKQTTAGGAVSVGTIPHSDLTGIGTDDHHAKSHASNHTEGGADEVDATTLKNAHASAIALGGG